MGITIKKETLNWLYKLKSKIFFYMPEEWSTPMSDALDVAIKALEQEPKSEWEHDHEILKAYSDGANEIADKIRAEIMDRGAYEREVNGNTEFLRGIIYSLDIIDKCKAECEK